MLLKHVNNWRIKLNCEARTKRERVNDNNNNRHTENFFDTRDTQCGHDKMIRRFFCLVYQTETTFGKQKRTNNGKNIANWCWHTESNKKRSTHIVSVKINRIAYTATHIPAHDSHCECNQFRRALLRRIEEGRGSVLMLEHGAIDAETIKWTIHEYANTTDMHGNGVKASVFGWIPGDFLFRLTKGSAWMTSHHKPFLMTFFLSNSMSELLTFLYKFFEFTNLLM